MPQKRFGTECERCRDKFRKGEEVYLAWLDTIDTAKYRAGVFLLCGDCAQKHVKRYIFLAYLVFVGGVSK